MSEQLVSAYGHTSKKSYLAWARAEDRDMTVFGRPFCHWHIVRGNQLVAVCGKRPARYPLGTLINWRPEALGAPPVRELCRECVRLTSRTGDADAVPGT